MEEAFGVALIGDQMNLLNLLIASLCASAPCLVVRIAIAVRPPGALSAAVLVPCIYAGFHSTDTPCCIGTATPYSGNTKYCRLVPLNQVTKAADTTASACVARTKLWLTARLAAHPCSSTDGRSADVTAALIPCAAALPKAFRICAETAVAQLFIAASNCDCSSTDITFSGL